VQDADLAVATAPTAIALRPARREQIRPTRLLVGEPPLELDDRSREVRTRHQPTVRRTSDGTNRIVTYRPYGDMIVLDRCHDLAVHHRRRRARVRLTRSGHIATGTRYANRYISVLTITDRKVTRWRDYLDPVAIFDAVGWPSH